MSENEKRLLDLLRRLVECLDYASISFDQLPEGESLEASLEFDEAYVAACEALGLDLTEKQAAGNPPPKSE